MDDRQKLAELNKKLYNAQMALSKWNVGERSEIIKAEIKALQAEKAQLPAELLHEEKVENATKGLEKAVHRVRKFPDIVINRHDVEKSAQHMLALGIPKAEIDAIIGDALDKKAEGSPTLSSDDAKELLKKLTQNVKSYLDDLSFKAELDPSYSVPDDVVAHIQSWDIEESLSNVQNKVLRTINELRAGQVAESDILIAIRGDSSPRQ